MAPECCAVRRPRRPPAHAALAVLSGVVLAILPKCPICVAVYLSAVGVSAAIAAPMLWGLRVASAMTLVIALAWLAVRLAPRLAWRGQRRRGPQEA